MIVYQAEKHRFLEDVRKGDIDEVILARFKAKIGRSVSRGEQRSWGNSLQYVANVLDDENLDDDLGVAVEFVLPQSLKRIDVTIAGHARGGERHAVIIELKQWETAKGTDRDGIVLTYVGGAERREVHPSYQAWSYAAFLRGFNEAVYGKDGVKLQPCVYLHNYKRDGVIDAAHYGAYLEEAPLFAKGERDRLRDFIRAHVPRGGGGKVLFELENGRIRPSKALADAVKGIVQGHREFVLLDEQKEVFETCLEAARTASPAAPRVIIVEGGPGTGKSVVAVHLVAALLSHRNLAVYVSKNAAPRHVFVEKLGKIKQDKMKLASLFSGPDRFMGAEPNAYGTLVVDESHRLTEKGGFYGNEGDHLIRDLVRAGTCAIFFLDESQQVTWKDVGSKAIISKFAAERGARLEVMRLESQFRCAGSDGYLAWIDHVLDIRQTANQTLEEASMEFEVFDDPAEMHAAIAAKNDRNKARVVAGYCWPWRSKRDPRANDIVIGDYARQWNLSQDGSLWIIAPESIKEVGCIHTCQGLEVDYVGVIIGPDLVMENGVLKTVPEARARHDKSIKGYKKDLAIDAEWAREKADRIIKNTYRTLMTRGMKGCYVYATDPEVRAYLRRLSGRAPHP
ncbi:DUF2075 domain-containing protein [Castellaniella sp. GW247-6E4]|uniref:DUF2075 domain-containing protein n=1 Tax=Castellaniella sp. GW247-6E4 TaxID=3140380 RepID=UPI00331626ED